MLSCEERAGRLVLTFAGRMDTLVCQGIEGEVMARVGGTALPIVFEMKEVSYVASAFLRLCVVVGQKVSPDLLTLANVAPPVKKVLKIAGLDTQLQVV